MNPIVKSFFDRTTFTVSYVIREPDGAHAAILDSVLDYDPKSGRTSTESADRIVDFVESGQLSIDWILETHAHADHLTAAPYLKEKLGGQIAIGERIVEVQAIFGEIFNAGPEFAADGSQFDRLFADGDTFNIGSLEVGVMNTPGHTPACLSYVVGDAAFVGDTLFMPDYGTARADFPGGDAATLYRSIHKILSLPDDTRVFLCHDYLSPHRNEYVWESTVAEQREYNVHIGNGVSEQDFIRMREERDAGLDMPVLILPSVQVNMRAGHLPPAEENGVSYLKIPVNSI